MRTSDPVGRWAPYEQDRRRARASGVAGALLVLTLLAVVLVVSKLAFLGLAVAP